jgi:hypothetical protein
MDRQTCRHCTADNVRHTRKVLDGLGLVLAPALVRTSSTRYSIFCLTLRFIFLHGDISFCITAHSHEPRRFRHAMQSCWNPRPLPTRMQRDAEVSGRTRGRWSARSVRPRVQSCRRGHARAPPGPNAGRDYHHTGHFSYVETCRNMQVYGEQIASERAPSRRIRCVWTYLAPEHTV